MAYLENSESANRVRLQDRHKYGKFPLLTVVDVLLDGLIQEGKILLETGTIRSVYPLLLGFHISHITGLYLQSFTDVGLLAFLCKLWGMRRTSSYSTKSVYVERISIL